MRAGYEAIGSRYQTFRDDFGGIDWLAKFRELLPRQARVLDAGCGTGAPTSTFLVGSGCEVVGIDVSSTMVELASTNVPGARFQVMDLLDMDMGPCSFDGIVSTYVIIHIPRENHPEVFRRFHRTLAPGGIILVTMGAIECEGVGELLGTRLYWSHYDREGSLRTIEEAGFDVIEEEVVTAAKETHLWVLARRR